MKNIVTIEEVLDESMTYDTIETFTQSKPVRPECRHTGIQAYRNTDVPEYRRTGWRCDRGEGVISTAIAVLIMAFLGAAMWVGFNTIWNTAETDIKDQIEIIGSSSTS